MRVADAHPAARAHAGDGGGVLGAAAGSSSSRPTRTWSGAARPRRCATASRTSPRRRCFPGLVILVLAIAGLGLGAAIRAGCAAGSAWGWWRSRSWRSGSGRRAGSLWPYRVVYDVLPGWEAIRAPGQAGHLLVAGACAARRRRARSERCWAALARRLSGRAAVAAIAAAPASLAIVDRGTGASRSTRSTTRPSPRCPRCRRRLRRSPRRSSTCRPSGRPTTAATCCGRPTASRRSSTGARASTRPSPSI